MRSVQFSDSEILNGLIRQDERILKACYFLYFSSVQRYVLANNGNTEDARDLFQDILMVLFQKARDSRFELTCALGTYVFSVGRRLWLKELNKRKYLQFQPVETDLYVDGEADIEEVGDKNERLVYFRKCFDQLSENCRRVLTLFTEGFSIAEITRLMGYKSEQHTKNRRYRCKLSLIKSINDQYKTKQ